MTDLFERPSLDVLRRVSAALTAADIPHALGGSGLLGALGLVDRVRDWDITTDAPPSDVLRALARHNATLVAPSGQFLTEGMIRLTVDQAPFDIICRFAIRHEGGVWPFPTIQGGVWDGVPLSRPEPWLVAYMLMGREPRVGPLLEHLRVSGADLAVVRRLRKGLLPAGVLDALASIDPQR